MQPVDCSCHLMALAVNRRHLSQSRPLIAGQQAVDGLPLDKVGPWVKTKSTEFKLYINLHKQLLGALPRYYLCLCCYDDGLYPQSVPPPLWFDTRYQATFSCLTLRQSRSINILSNARPRPSILIVTPSRFNTPVKASLVNYEPCAVEDLGAAMNAQGVFQTINTEYSLYAVAEPPT